MATAILKYFGTWFAVILLGAAVFYLIAGSPSILSMAVKTQYEENCTSAGSGGSFFDESKSANAECYENAERAIAQEAESARSSMMIWYFTASLVPLVFGLLFALQLSMAERTASTPSAFAALKPRWWSYLGVITVGGIVLAGLAHFGQLFDGWGSRLAVSYGWGLPLLLIAIFWISYAAGTRLAAPQKMKPSIPF